MQPDRDHQRAFIASLLEERGWTATELARKAGIASTTLTRFLYDNDHPHGLSVGTMSKISRAAGLSVAQILTDSPQTGTAHKEPIERIPIYNLRASAGYGALAEDGDPIAWQPYRVSELRQLTGTRAEDLALILVSGDSMIPTLLPGDQLMIDRSVKHVGRDGIYVLGIGDDVLVKRCQLNVQARAILVKSDNPLYETLTITDFDSFRVLGLAIWAARALQ